MSAEADAILVRVRDRLSDKSRWHGDAASRRGDFGCGGALDAQGRQVASCDPTAVRHCVIGALKVEAQVPEGKWPLPGAVGEAFDRVAVAAGWEPGMCWNDRDGYDAVLTAVSKAIEGA
jgi:hypothetical protein